ncbi:unnamed protein product [Adineta steineri]|uniref:G-protein coupled receptors family 1 profile domain-containing protein n=1 Tax=Adineta steineri TaxID=433720 RepID=A0A815U8H9_9BILA|nr:unnamed protein product [Adineta steineri]CAF3787444.1 unnamed protein product [Adineta steineri]
MRDGEDFYIIISIIFIFLTIITLIFSSLTILIIIANWKFQCRSITNLLICNSCTCLLYYAIATIMKIAFMMISDLTKYISLNTTFCQLSAALYFSACISVSLSFLVQAISRYFITILYKYKILLTFRINWILIISNWMISFIIPGFMFISPLAYHYESESRMCILTIKHFSTSFSAMIVIFCIPLCIIIFLYGLILQQSVHQNQIDSNTFAMLRMKRNLKVFRNILISVTILGIGGTPYFICDIINRFIQIPSQLYSLSILFISISTTLNSLASCFINKKIRKLFYSTIKCQERETRTHINQILPIIK